MNDSLSYTRSRNKTLLIVEGKHEKGTLFKLLFELFPEISIDYKNVWIYGTNIYMLNHEIEQEYGMDWAHNEDDIDLPFVISRNHPEKTGGIINYKSDYTNIFLVFDYERQDPDFNEPVIMAMQKHFYDSTDMGKLYINYPMVEAYLHFKQWPDPSFKDLSISSALRKGSDYKNQVYRDSCLRCIFSYPEKLRYVIQEYLKLTDFAKIKMICDSILCLYDRDCLEEDIRTIASEAVSEQGFDTFIHMTISDIGKMGYMSSGKNYFQYVKQIVKQIIAAHACKGNKIQTGSYSISRSEYDRLDLIKILDKQNTASKDAATGYIWVINTSIFLVPDYNYSLIE